MTLLKPVSHGRVQTKNSEIESNFKKFYREGREDVCWSLVIISNKLDLLKNHMLKEWNHPLLRNIRFEIGTMRWRFLKNATLWLSLKMFIQCFHSLVMSVRRSRKLVKSSLKTEEEWIKQIWYAETVAPKMQRKPWSVFLIIFLGKKLWRLAGQLTFHKLLRWILSVRGIRSKVYVIITYRV